MSIQTSPLPKLSDWSMPQFNDRTSQLALVNKPLKVFIWFKPCVLGLLLGLLSNGATLAVIITIWIKSFKTTGVIIKNEIPPGTIVLYSGNLSNLNGSTYRWLLCDGSEVSRLTYQDLFGVIGETYGVGNGNDTFNLPDFRGHLALGSNTSNDSQLVQGGSSSHVLTIAEMPSHTHDQGSLSIDTSSSHVHSLIDPGHNHGGSTGTQPYSSGSYSMISSVGSGNDNGNHQHSIPYGPTGITVQSDGIHTHSIQGTTGYQGGNQAMDIMPPYQTIHYIIRG